MDSENGEGEAVRRLHTKKKPFESICAANQHDGLPSGLFDKVARTAR